MTMIIPIFKKFGLAALVIAIGLVALPALNASAANSQTVGSTRLEQVWARAQAVYQRQGDRLAKADALIARAQALIDRAAQKGRDTSAVQAALNAFAAVIPAAQAAHDPGTAIIASRNGFDANGKVTDRAAAVVTVKALRHVLKDTRTALNGTGQALHEAVKAFRAAHKPPTP